MTVASFSKAVVCGAGINAHTIIQNLSRLGYAGNLVLLRDASEPPGFAGINNRGVEQWAVAINEPEELPALIEARYGDSGRVAVFFTDERYHPAFKAWTKTHPESPLHCFLGSATHLTDILDRYRFCRFIEQRGLAKVPRTIAGDEDPFAAFGNEFIVRPRMSWYGVAQRERVRVVRGRDGFHSVLKDYGSRGLGQADLSFQELLSIRNEDNVSVCGWFGPDSRHLFCTRKVLQYPPGTGGGDLVERISPLAELMEQAEAILKAMAYEGPFEMEFVFDDQSREFKVTELNPRFWLQHGLIEAVSGCALVSNYLGWPLLAPSEREKQYRYWVNPLYSFYRAFRFEFRSLRTLWSRYAWRPFGIREATHYARCYTRQQWSGLRSNIFGVFTVKEQISRAKTKASAKKKEARVPWVCQLASGHNPEDERILHRMARTALDCGYRSSFVVPHEKGSTQHGVTLVPCPKMPKRGSKWRRWTAFLPILWWAMRSRVDLFQIHDPDLIPPGLLLKLFGRRVIYDVHDDYQASLQDRLRRKPWLVGWFPSFWWWFERNAARAFDGVIVADRHLANKFGHCHPVILGNYPRLDFTAPADPEVTETFNLIYVGGVTRERGLGMALDALKQLPMPELRLHVIGTGRDQELLDALRAEPRVILHGRIPWTRLHEFYTHAHVGLALYQPLAGFLYYPGENAVKVIEYMAARIPVLCSDFPGLRAFVADAGCGLVVTPDDPEAIAQKISELFYDEALRLRLGRKGRELFETEYNWDKHAGKLVDLYERVLSP
ncbi:MULTISPECIES: glycosyltransferase family 4 protein [Ectothiorhodospira]|uniref:glycosyltransferase family 4 protein n=1 Tax=Ectothiorhodospira TaxID=1051 RepID=UPI001906564A|nr:MULTISPECIES: glycosyltransferase family 4 protein [Ectothiorhodospira]MBK1674786.1 hypothetical protein [Ectothiorhodospira shaposhnikovii]MCG5501300.1 glycosyltransferase [Ectothiorhodospira lacustris]